MSCSQNRKRVHPRRRRANSTLGLRGADAFQAGRRHDSSDAPSANVRTSPTLVTTRPKALLAGAVVTGLGGVVFCYGIATGGPLLEQQWGVLALLGVWWIVFAVGAAVVLRLPLERRW